MEREKKRVWGRDFLRIRQNFGTDFFPGEKKKQMVWIVGLGPVGLDSDWIRENERDCWPWGNPIRIPKKTTQTTNFPFVDDGMWKKMAVMYISDDVGEKHKKEKKTNCKEKNDLH